MNSSKQTNNWLAKIFENLGEVFEKFNPAAFRFLAAVLPYSTPFPVAWLTMKSAEEFLAFTPAVAFIFVFGLEGMGLWFTSLFVDSVIETIRSRNSKTVFLVLLFAVVVFAYIAVLVSLNVTLKAATGDINLALQRVITLLCFLPLLTGVGNGYYKWKLEHGIEMKTLAAHDDEKEEKIRQENNELKIKKAMLKQGMNPLASPVSPTPVPAVQEPQRTAKKKDDWRLLTVEEKREVVHVLTIQEIMKKYGVGRATSYNWKSKTV